MIFSSPLVIAGIIDTCISFPDSLISGRRGQEEKGDRRPDALRAYQLMNVGFSKPSEMVKDRETWRCSLRVAKSRAVTEQLNKR